MNEHFLIGTPAPGDNRPRNVWGVLTGFGEAYRRYYERRDVKQNIQTILTDGAKTALVKNAVDCTNYVALGKTFAEELMKGLEPGDAQVHEVQGIVASTAVDLNDHIRRFVGRKEILAAVEAVRKSATSVSESAFVVGKAELEALFLAFSAKR